MRGEGGYCSSQPQLFVASNRLGGKKKRATFLFPFIAVIIGMQLIAKLREEAQ